MYSENKKVEYCDCDLNGHIKIDYLFSRFGEIATKDAYNIGIYDKKLEGDYGWIVSKQTLKLDQPIFYNDSIELFTKHMKPSMVIFPRYYEIRKDRNVYGKCYSHWTLIDLNKRKIVKPTKVGLTIPETDEKIENVKTLIFNEEMTYIKTYKVVYSDIDMNKHMNNTKYVKLALDLIDLEYLNTHLLKEISINYNKEIKYNEDIKLYMNKYDDTYHIKGMVNNIDCFKIEMLWSINSNS